jgi:hypothetical protein
MTEQVAVLFLDEDERVWELVTDQEDDPVEVWEVEANALRDLENEGSEIEGPFEMRPQFPDTPEVRAWGYTLRRSVQ